MNHIIIGTAGHVDHGKTTLVKALTGCDTDRLKEEKERGISIELGFASFSIDQQKFGLIDVPGHEKFIKQMLSGVAGIDLVLLIVAADEGVMPQTQEHLDILSLLNVQKGIVVITKADLVDDEWLELVADDIEQIMAKTPLKDAPIVAVSSTTGKGIDTIKQLIVHEIKNIEMKKNDGKPRMPIDRAFSITGFGTVVAGTLWSGQVQVGDKLIIYPKNIEGKIRHLQVHGQSVSTATAGQRVAINLGNISLTEIQRGDVLAAADMLKPTHRLDVKITLLENWKKKLEHRQRVRVYLGTKEILGRVFFLDREELEPGENCVAQLVLEEEAVALKEDNFVLRSYSPMYTIGGGTVIDPIAKKVKRYRPEILEQIQVKLEGTQEEIVLQLIKEKPYLEISNLVNDTNTVEAELISILNELKNQKKIISLNNNQIFISAEKFRQYTEKAEVMLTAYHQRYPLRSGMQKEELRSKLDGVVITQKIFNLIVDEWGNQNTFTPYEDKISLKNFKPKPSIEQQEILDKIQQLLAQDLFQPPTKKELFSQIGLTEELIEEYLLYLITDKKIIKISEEIYLHTNTITKIKEITKCLYQEKGEIQLGEVRNITNSSRKYVLPILEYLDQIKFTKRIGDKRVLY